MTTTTRVMIRNSERMDFTDCRQKWWWAYQDRLRPSGSDMNALVFGDIIHRALSSWYIPEKDRKKVVRRVRPAITVEKIFDKLELDARSNKVRVVDHESQEFVDAKELGINMMEHYFEHYGMDDEFMVIYPEMPFQLDIYSEQGLYVCTFVGTTDCLVYERRSWQMGLLEHKTAAQITTEHLLLDPQASTYWTILPIWLREEGVLKPDQDIHFMEYNFMRKAVLDDDRPKNGDGMYLNSPKVAALREALDAAGHLYRKTLKKDELIELCDQVGVEWRQLGEVSATQPTGAFIRQKVYRNQVQREREMERILQQAREMRMVRNGSLALYKSPSKMKCQWCAYRDLCEIHELGHDVDGFIESAFHHWNPYRDHIWSLNLEGV